MQFAPPIRAYTIRWKFCLPHFWVWTISLHAGLIAFARFNLTIKFGHRGSIKLTGVSNRVSIEATTENMKPDIIADPRVIVNGNRI